MTALNVTINGVRYIPAPAPVEITAYSQRDARWRADTMGGTTQTIGSYGCAMVCAAMVHSKGKSVSATPQYMNAYLTKHGGYNIVNHNEAHLAWDRLPGLYRELIWLGRKDWVGVPVPQSELDALIDKLLDHPVILWVDFYPGGGFNTHFVLGTGVTGGGDIEIIDPWDGARTRLLERYARNDWDLTRAIYGYRELIVR